MKKQAKGITLIALVITIIVLLILASVAINLTLGKNGIFTKAKEAAIKQDIEETRELIKLELMGSISEETTDYTNKDVIDAIKKVTGQIINEGEETVMSKKNNPVSISELWRTKFVMYFPRIWHYYPEQEYAKITFEEGQIWNEEFLESIADEIDLHSCDYYHFFEDGLIIRPDSYTTISISLNDMIIKKGDLLIPNAKYEIVY